MKFSYCLSTAVRHSLKRLLQPLNVIPREMEVKSTTATSISQKLMTDVGIIRPVNNGFFHLLPLGAKSLHKLIKLVDHHVNSIGAQNMFLPMLSTADIWQKSGRLATSGKELFTLNDRHYKQFVLNPTHEESVAHLVASIPPISHHKLPLLLYQTAPKFRDEMKPRFGLIRSKEFVMQDLYSFDKSVEDAMLTYETVCALYCAIFDQIGVPYVKGAPGMMGGEMSHEFHFPAEIGDDNLLLCTNCNNGMNQELAENVVSCSKCGSSALRQEKGIEVGHTFMLGTHYTSLLNAVFISESGAQCDTVMCSFGLGLTRILAASLEVLSLPEEIRWPLPLAPYLAVIITPKKGSKESATADGLGEELYDCLQREPLLRDNVLLDDRDQLTIGKRLKEARRTGYPFSLVVGKAAAVSPPQYELHDLASGQIHLLELSHVARTLVRLSTATVPPAVEPVGKLTGSAP